MPEYIDREAVMEAISEAYGDIASAEDFVRAIPAADVVEVRRGRWNRDGRCDQCGEHAPFWCMASTYYLSNYCPGCGAKMDGGPQPPKEEA